VQQRNKNSMQKFTRKYEQFLKELRVAQVTFDSKPTAKNLKKLSDLKAIKWTNATRYSAYYLKLNKMRLAKTKTSYGKLAMFFSNTSI
jgi:hypothetical protein